LGGVSLSVLDPVVMVSGPHFESPSVSVFVLGSSTNRHKITEMAHRFNIKTSSFIDNENKVLKQGSNGIVIDIT
jgi:hypothetical protein